MPNKVETHKSLITTLVERDDVLCGNDRKDFALRKKIEDTKAEYIEHYGELGWQYTDEGLPYAIQDYHGCVGSVMDFTADDWLACKENGWTLDEVCRLCDELWFNEEDDNGGIEREIKDEDVPQEVVVGFVADFYKWRNELLPAALKVYAD